MQRRLKEDEKYSDISDYVKDNFFDIRTNAEELARLNFFHRGIEEITLEQIYDAVGTITFVDEDAKEALCKLEKSV